MQNESLLTSKSGVAHMVSSTARPVGQRCWKLEQHLEVSMLAATVDTEEIYCNLKQYNVPWLKQSLQGYVTVVEAGRVLGTGPFLDI